MQRTDNQITSESVTEGHPDKIADQISDAILDAYLSGDPDSHVACEVLVSHNLVVIAGEIASHCAPNIQEVACQVLREIGYADSETGIDPDSCEFIIRLNSQSPDCATPITLGYAGDQCTAVGYATAETEELMPLPTVLANKLAVRLTEVRKLGLLKYLRPDGKTQVTIRYKDYVPESVTCIVISPQHDPSVDLIALRREVIEKVIEPVVPNELFRPDTKFFINESNKFSVGGPAGDTGLTGRKIMVDTYGGLIPHGGGAFSGKDPTKIDRVASYMARYIAKNIVSAGLADRCLIQLTYARGSAKPVVIGVDTFGTGRSSEFRIKALFENTLDLSIEGMVERLRLRRPIYRKTSVYGHFGRRDQDFTWERNDLAPGWSELINSV